MTHCDIVVSFGWNHSESKLFSFLLGTLKDLTLRPYPNFYWIRVGCVMAPIVHRFLDYHRTNSIRGTFAVTIKCWFRLSGGGCTHNSPKEP